MRCFRMGKKWWIGLLVLSLSLSLVSVAWAQPPAPGARRAIRRPPLRGEVTAVDGRTLSVNAQRGAVTVLTDDRTRFRVPGTDAATLADVQVGDLIAMWGRRESEGALHARLILVIPEGATVLRDEVAALEVDGFRLQTRREDPGLDDLLQGAWVLIGGIQNQDETILTRIVGARPAHPRSPQGGLPLP